MPFLLGIKPTHVNKSYTIKRVRHRGGKDNLIYYKKKIIKAKNTKFIRINLNFLFYSFKSMLKYKLDKYIYNSIRTKLLKKIIKLNNKK